MSSEHRSVTLKNDDPRITYTGEWASVEANTVINLGNFGPALSPTLHTTVSIASFSLSFNGSSINVLGTINITNSSTNPNPTWTCSLDGISLGPPNLSDAVENNWSLCSLLNFPDGAHELTVNVTSDGIPFYLDYVNYRSSPDVSLENSFITIQNPDPAIDYILGWSILDGFGSIANQTSDPNGLVNVTFIGIQLSWYGLISNDAPRDASSGEYFIDGGPSTPFILSGPSPTATATLFNQVFFITPNLVMGTHVLSVKYTGESGQTPLTLDLLIVMNGSFPSAGGLPTNSSGNTNGTKTHASNPLSSIQTSFSGGDKSSSNHVVIIGAVVGSIVGVAMTIIFLIWFKSHRKRSRGPPHEIMPFLPQLTPAPLLQTNQIPKDPTQHTSTGNTTVMPAEPLNSNPISTTSLYAHNLAAPTNPSSLYTDNPAAPQIHDSQPPAVTSVPTGDRLSPPVTSSDHTSNTIFRESRILRQHEDSGLRLRQSVTVEEVDIPPIYTEN